MVVVIKKGATKNTILLMMKRVMQERKTKGINVRKYCGVIKLKEDALIIQKRMRDEWE